MLISAKVVKLRTFYNPTLVAMHISWSGGGKFDKISYMN